MRGIRICISCSMPPPQQRDDRNHTDTGTPTVVVDAIHAHPRSDDRDDAPANARKIHHREGDSEHGVAAKEAIKCTIQQHQHDDANQTNAKRAIVAIAADGDNALIPPWMMPATVPHQQPLALSNQKVVPATVHGIHHHNHENAANAAPVPIDVGPLPNLTVLEECRINQLTTKYESPAIHVSNHVAAAPNPTSVSMDDYGFAWWNYGLDEFDVTAQQSAGGGRGAEFSTGRNDAKDTGRIRWTPKLHDGFVDAVSKLGGPDAATPKRILLYMLGLPDKTSKGDVILARKNQAIANPQLEHISIVHIKSHLQKYRSHMGLVPGVKKRKRSETALVKREEKERRRSELRALPGKGGAATNSQTMMLTEDGVVAPSSNTADTSFLAMVLAAEEQSAPPQVHTAAAGVATPSTTTADALLVAPSHRRSIRSHARTAGAKDDDPLVVQLRTQNALNAFLKELPLTTTMTPMTTTRK
ncbi:phosphate starvation response protein [Pycnococcus provasolii]